MFITWHGLSCIKIFGREVSMVLDPFAKIPGLTTPRLGKADIVAYSHQEEGRERAGQDCFVIDGPGEYEVKGIAIRGLGYLSSEKDRQQRQTAYRFELEGISLAHLGYLNEQLPDDKLDIIEGVDILFIPVGGKDVLSSERAIKVINQIEPRIIIPMHYRAKGMKVKYDPDAAFLKEVGKKEEEAVDKFRIVKKDLPQDGNRIVILKCS